MAVSVSASVSICSSFKMRMVPVLAILLSQTAVLTTVNGFSANFINPHNREPTPFVTPTIRTSTSTDSSSQSVPLPPKPSVIQESLQTNQHQQIQSQLSILSNEGVLKIPSALSPSLSSAFFDYITDQKVQAWLAGFAASEDDEYIAQNRAFHGDRHARSDHACDLQLSLLRGGFAADFNKNVSTAERHILADVLEELYGVDGTVGGLCEELMTDAAVLCELAAWITEPGYPGHGLDQPFRTVHNDDNNSHNDSDIAPFYTMALALDDINEHMGQLNFFTRTHRQSTSSTESESEPEPDSDASPIACQLQKGDAVIFDARTLRAEGANHPSAGRTSTIIYLTFSNAHAHAHEHAHGQSNSDSEPILDGSIRPGYRGQVTLGDIQKALSVHDNDNNGDRDDVGSWCIDDVFKAYGDGISKEFVNTFSSSAEDTDGELQVKHIQLGGDPIDE